MLLGRSWENLETLHTGVFSYSWSWILLLTQKLGKKVAIKGTENSYWCSEVLQSQNMCVFMCQDICILEINIWGFVYIHTCTHTLISYIHLYMFQIYVLIFRSPRSTWRNSFTSFAKNNIFRIKLVFLCFCNLLWLVIFVNRRSYMFWRCHHEFWFLLIELYYVSSVSSSPYSFEKYFHRLKLIMKKSSNTQEKSILKKLKIQKQITKFLIKTMLPVGNIKRCSLEEVEYYDKMKSDNGKVSRFEIELLQ